MRTARLESVITSNTHTHTHTFYCHCHEVTFIYVVFFYNTDCFKAALPR